MTGRSSYLPDDMNHWFDLNDDSDRAAEQVGEQIAGMGRFLEDARNAPPGFFSSKNWLNIGQGMADALARGIAEGTRAPGESDD